MTNLIIKQEESIQLQLKKLLLIARITETQIQRKRTSAHISHGISIDHNENFEHFGL